MLYVIRATVDDFAYLLLSIHAALNLNLAGKSGTDAAGSMQKRRLRLCLKLDDEKCTSWCRIAVTLCGKSGYPYTATVSGFAKRSVLSVKLFEPFPSLGGSGLPRSKGERSFTRASGHP